MAEISMAADSTAQNFGKSATGADIAIGNLIGLPALRARDVEDSFAIVRWRGLFWFVLLQD
jgi:hypothetical protein